MITTNETYLPDTVFGNGTIPILLTSDMTANAKFRYIVNFRRQGEDFNVLTENMRQRPNPSGSALFDIGGRPFSILQYDDDIFGSTFQIPTKSVQQYEFVIGEEFAGSNAETSILYDGQDNVGAPATTSKTFTVIKGPHNVDTFGLVKQVPNILTQLPPQVDVSVSHEFDHYITVFGSSVSVVFSSIGNDGTTNVIASENHTLNNRPGIIGCGIKQLRSRASNLSAFNTGITSGWRAYTVRVSGTGFDRTYTFNLDRRPRQWDVTCFTFINRFGYWDSFEALALPSANRSAVKNFAEVNTTTVTATTVSNEVANTNGRTVYAQPLIANGIQFTSAKTARTKTFDRDTGEWLFDIVQSPDVRVQEGSSYIPVRITPQTFNVPQDPTRNGTYELEINYSYAI